MLNGQQKGLVGAAARVLGTLFLVFKVITRVSAPSYVKTAFHKVRGECQQENVDPQFEIQTGQASGY